MSGPGNNTGSPAPLTRRAFHRLLAVVPGAAVAAPVPASSAQTMRRAQAALLVRGLARVNQSDPVMRAQTRAMVAELAQQLPEAEELFTLHRLHGSQAPATWQDTADPDNLELLHEACVESRPVAFGYVDLKGQETARTVRPIEVVYPRTGTQLLAYCERRQAQRKFFVRSMQGVRVLHGTFGDQRRALIRDAIADVSGRMYREEGC